MDLLEHAPGGVRAAIVHDHDFVGNLLQAQFEMEVLNGGGDTAFFVAGRNHHGERAERLAGEGRRRSHTRLTSSQSGWWRACCAMPSRMVGERHLDLPAEIRGSPRVVHHHPRNVIHARFRIGGRSMAPEAFIAPGGELRERHRVGGTAAGGIDSLSIGAGCAHLSDQQGRQIARMKSVPSLVAGAVESDVANRPAPQMRVHPKGENALSRRAELSCAGEHAATCDPYREIERPAIFEGHDFRG